jgi:hypothetical protein
VYEAPVVDSLDSLSLPFLEEERFTMEAEKICVWNAGIAVSA